MSETTSAAVTAAFDSAMAEANTPELDAPETTVSSAAEPDLSGTPAPSADETVPPRDEHGRFAPRTKTADSAPDDAPPADAATAAATSPEGQATDANQQPPAPAWEPYAVTEDRQTVTPIPSAQVLRENGYVMVAMPEADYVQHQRLVSRGVRYDKVYQQVRQLEQQVSAPKPPSENETAATVVLEYLQKLESGDPEIAELVAANPKLFFREMMREAQLRHFTAAQQHTEVVQQHQQTAQQAEEAEHYQTTGLEQVMESIVQRDPAFGVLSPADRQTVYADLLYPIRDRLIYRDESGEWVANEAYIAKVIGQVASAKQAQAKAAEKAQQAAQFNARVQPRPAAPQPKPVVAAPAAAEEAKPSRKWGYFQPGQFLADADDD